MNLKGWMSWQISLVCAGCTLFGAGAALVVNAHIVQADMASVAGDLRRKSERVKLLEGLVLQQSRTSVARALDQAPEPQRAPTDEAAAAQAEPVQKVSAPPAPPPDTASPPDKDVVSSGGDRAREKAKVATKPRTPPVTTVATAPAAVAASSPAAVREQAHSVRAGVDEAAQETTAAPTAAEVAAVVKTARIEGVSADKAGVERISAGAVHLRGGRTIKVGSSFPSGERLLAVDPENGRIITNQRQILMFF